MQRWSAQVAFGAAIAYLLLTGWAMQRTTLRRVGCAGDRPGDRGLPVSAAAPDVPATRPRSAAVCCTSAWLAKIAGSLARYWVHLDAYGGNADAGRYHDVGESLAGQIRSGEVSILRVIPSGAGTEFIERFDRHACTPCSARAVSPVSCCSAVGYWGARAVSAGRDRGGTGPGPA